MKRFHVVLFLSLGMLAPLSITVSSVTFDATYSGAGLGSLTLDSAGHSSITLFGCQRGLPGRNGK